MINLGMPVAELDTPCLLVDLDRMASNIDRWQARITAGGVQLRPHVKTHKSPTIGRMQLNAGAAGITVAKLAEAEIFAAHGCEDIFIAYPLIGAEKWRRATALAQRCTLTVGVDSVVGAEGLSAAAQVADVTVRVCVEIDTGLHRSGVQPADAPALCRVVHDLPGLELDGIFTYRGAFFADAVGRSATELAHEEGSIMVALAEHIRASGLPIRTVSVGSTPTGLAAARVPGVTEVRPGTYIFGDYMQAAGGFIDDDEIALTILCTVISRPAVDVATIDGGSKTFGGDVVPARLGLHGYARAVGREAYLESMTEEHGVVRLEPGFNPQIGERIAFHPIHVCTTVNLSDTLVGVHDGRVAEIWPVLARGART